MSELEDAVKNCIADIQGIIKPVWKLIEMIEAKKRDFSRYSKEDRKKQLSQLGFDLMAEADLASQGIHTLDGFIDVMQKDARLVALVAYAELEKRLYMASILLSAHFDQLKESPLFDELNDALEKRATLWILIMQ